MAAPANIGSEPRPAKRAGLVFALFGAVAALAGGAVAVASILRDGGWEGWLGGIFGGGFLALLIMGAGAWVVMAMVLPRKKTGPDAADLAHGAELEASLRDVLAELETSRLETLVAINARALWRVPLLAAAGLAVWIIGQFGEDPGDIADLGAMLIVPGIMGYAWASLELSAKYARLYKSRVLPKLASGFGDLNYRHAVLPDLAGLKEEQVFRRFERAYADDEIFGTHRGLPVNIVELRLEVGSGKNKRTVFDGLLVSIDLPRDTQAVTAVVSDEGAFGNFRDRMKTGGRQRVALEDVLFEKVYEVYSTDQIAARALLHPAFMEKLLALGELADFQRPFVLCSGRILQFAMPKRMGRNLFEAPSYRKPAASRETLAQLHKDIAAVLAATDAVIDLDHRFEVMARR